MKDIYSICLFFFKKIPFNLIISIFSTLLDQLFLILAYFLPLKVIILLNMQELPTYLVAFFPTYNREEIILILTILTFIVYGASILMDSYSEKLIFKSIEVIMQKKFISITPQNKLIYKFVHSFFKLISTFVLLLFIFFVLIYIFPSVSIFLSLYIIVVYSIFKLYKINEDRYSNFFKVSSGIGFMMVFIYEVIDILYLKTQEVTLFIILLSIVGARYIFTRGHYMLNQLLFVHKNIEKFHQRIDKLMK